MDTTPEEDAKAISEEYEARQEALRQAAEFLCTEAEELEKTALVRPSVAANRLAFDMLAALPQRRVAMNDKECVEIIDDREKAVSRGGVPAIEVLRTSHDDGSQEVVIRDNMIDLDHYRQLEVTTRPDVYGQVDVFMVEQTKRTPVDPDRAAEYVARVAHHLSEIAPRLTTDDDASARRIAAARVRPLSL